jgi:hypothetical protein
MIGRTQAGEATMNNAARIRQRILALFLPLTAVLYVSCEAANPKGTDIPILTMTDAIRTVASGDAVLAPGATKRLIR